jgi:hypothetical protein
MTTHFFLERFFRRDCSWIFFLFLARFLASFGVDKVNPSGLINLLSSFGSFSDRKQAQSFISDITSSMKE